MERGINRQVVVEGIQLVTISHPTSYEEYTLYISVENEFEKLISK